jgi:hypothetical protein
MNFLSTTIIGANRSAGLLLGGFGVILAERVKKNNRHKQIKRHKKI